MLYGCREGRRGAVGHKGAFTLMYRALVSIGRWGRDIRWDKKDAGNLYRDVWGEGDVESILDLMGLTGNFYSFPMGVWSGGS